MRLEKRLFVWSELAKSYSIALTPNSPVRRLLSEIVVEPNTIPCPVANC
jgi:hypothetical protein